MTQHLVLQVLVFLGVMVAVTVVPAIFIFLGVAAMRAWMSPKGPRHVHHTEGSPADESADAEA